MEWIWIGLGIWVALEILLSVLGLFGPVVWLAVAIWHGFLKLDNSPGANDDNWSQDQGKEAK